MGQVEDRRARRLRRGRYRFDQAVVTGEWLALLLWARRHGGWKGGVNGKRGGLRTYAQQASLFALFKSGLGAPAFPPNGPSRHLIRNVRDHGWKQAVDVSDPEGLIRAAAKRGVVLHRPYQGEPWHVEAKKPFAAGVFK